MTSEGPAAGARPSAWLREQAYPLLAAGLLSVLLALFAIVEALQVPLLTDPGPTLAGAGALAGGISVALLVADVVVPLPASVVMTINGAIFGVGVGTTLSVVGGTGAALVGMAVGRRSRGLVNRLVPPARQEQAERLLLRYGTVAVVATRPVPLVAETTAIMAGVAGMPWRHALLGAGLGNLVPALVYAVAGAAAVSGASSVLVFGGVVLVAAALWVVARRRSGGGAG